MDDMVKKLMEEERRLTEAEELVEASCLSPKIDVAELLRNGYVSAEDYRKARDAGKRGLSGT